MVDERESLERAIAAQEALRPTLGDEVVDAVVTALRARLESLPSPDIVEHRRLVTILFADVTGFTGLAEERDAEELSASLRALWGEVDGRILAHGGTIDKHMGDAVLAVWGISESREDDPERAIRAALDLRDAAARMEIGGRPVRVRIGVNTGPVVVGPLGVGETAIVGDTVNVASRLHEAASPGGILVAHDTYRHVRGVFDVQEREQVQVRGRRAGVRAYEVLAAKQRAFRLQARGVEGVETPMVGRDAELARLVEILQTALEERELYVVTVLGEAGIGKSRLLGEFSDAVELMPERLRVFTGRARQESQGVPFGVVRDLFAFRFGIQESDPPAVQRETFERGVLRVLGETERDVAGAHAMGALFGFDFPASPHLEAARDDPRRMREMGFSAATRFLCAVAEEMPAVVFLEDIHWADDPSLDLVDHLARTCHDAPILILCLSRPTLLERRPQWGEGIPNHARVTLAPLSKRQSRRLVAEILREAEAVPEALRELVVGSAEGNPFYVEELIKMLIDEGVIRTETAPWRIDPGRLASARVPSTLAGILQARLDRLSARERAVLQRASVVGREFWQAAVERLGGGASEEVAEALESLRRKELVYRRERSEFEDTREFLFKHAILRDVTYESVLKRDRARWHGLVAEWLTERGGEGADRFAALIAGHYERADRPRLAAEWYGRAARRERGANDPELAVDLYRRAIDFAAEGEGARDLRVGWYAELGETLGMLARFQEAIEAYERMRAAARAAGDPVREAAAWNGRAFVEQRTGDYRALLASASRAERLAAEAGDSAEARLQRLVALVRMSDGHFRLGHADEQMALAEQALQLAVSLGDAALRERALALKLLGMGHQTAGRFPEAQRCKEEGLAITRRLGDRRMTGMMLNSLGETMRLEGDLEAARDRYIEALAVAREMGHRTDTMLCLNNLGGTRVALGEFAEAEADLVQAIAMADEAGYHVRAEAQRFLAEAFLGQGRVEEALDAARTALALSTDDNKDHLGNAWRVLGRVAAALDRPIDVAGGRTDARACFRESERIFGSAGMEVERARTLRDQAEFEIRSGRVTEGERLREEALDVFRRLGMAHEIARTSATADVAGRREAG